MHKPYIKVNALPQKGIKHLIGINNTRNHSLFGFFNWLTS